jgi:hypothetical protein
VPADFDAAGPTAAPILHQVRPLPSRQDTHPEAFDLFIEHDVVPLPGRQGFDRSLVEFRHGCAQALLDGWKKSGSRMEAVVGEIGARVCVFGARDVHNNRAFTSIYEDIAGVVRGRRRPAKLPHNLKVRGSMSAWYSNRLSMSRPRASSRMPEMRIADDAEEIRVSMRSQNKWMHR